MKKTIIIAGSLIIVIIGVLIAVPLVFKKPMMEAAKNTINKQFNATVEVEKFGLSLLKNFPEATLEMKNVSITGKADFQNDTLLNISGLRAKMSLSSLFNKDERSVDEIVLDDTKLNLIVLESGKANWDLTIEGNTTTVSTENKGKEKESDSSSFDLQLEKVSLKNAFVSYNDASAKTELDLDGINLEISGKMYGTSTELKAEGEIGRLNMNYAGTDYISNTEIHTNTLLDVNYEDMIFKIIDSDLKINRLPLNLTGSIEMPSDSMYFDLELETEASDFESFMALIPPDYKKFTDGIQTSGKAGIKGKISGVYFEEIYPAFSIKMEVDEGRLKYNDLPEEIKNINASVLVHNPGGKLDFTEVKVEEAHLEAKDNPLDLTLTLNNLFVDPWFDGAFIGKIDFNHIRDVLPFDTVNIAGVVDANLFFKGNYSSVEKEKYEEIKADGSVLLDNFYYASPELSQKIIVPEGRLDFSPEKIELQDFEMRVGKSDFYLTGEVRDYLSYLFNEGVLHGDFRLNSSMVNFNELLRLQVAKPDTVVLNAENRGEDAGVNSENNSEEAEILVFDVPENIDFSFRSVINRAVFDRLPISNIRGVVTARDGVLNLKGLDMEMLDGKLNLNGTYKNTETNQPFFNFGIKVSRFDIPQAYRTLSGIQKMIPVAGQSQGKMSTSLKMKGRLTEDLKLMAPTIDGLGTFSTENLHIINSSLFSQLNGILKKEKLKDVDVKDISAHFKVEDGNLLISPFTTEISGQEAKISGSLNTQSLLDMRVDFNIHREAFGPDIQNVLSAIPGNQKISIVPAGVIIKGPVGGPEVKMDLSETRKVITNAAKEDLGKSLNKLGEGLKKLFK